MSLFPFERDLPSHGRKPSSIGSGVNAICKTLEIRILRFQVRYFIIISTNIIGLARFEPPLTDVMKKAQILQLTAVIATLKLLALPVLASPRSEVAQPVKMIAPDLIIEIVEQGEFLEVDEKTHRADPRSFKAASIVPHRNRYLFGWRMKIKTTRKSILVQEHSVDGKGKQGAPTRLVPQHDYIFRSTDYVETIPAGKYTYVLFVENQPVKTFSYELK